MWIVGAASAKNVTSPYCAFDVYVKYSFQVCHIKPIDGVIANVMAPIYIPANIVVSLRCDVVDGDWTFGYVAVYRT